HLQPANVVAHTTNLEGRRFPVVTPSDLGRCVEPAVTETTGRPPDPSVGCRGGTPARRGGRRTASHPQTKGAARLPERVLLHLRARGGANRPGLAALVRPGGHLRLRRHRGTDGRPGGGRARRG